MEEQPVALAATMRSPKSCVSSFEIGRLAAAGAGPAVFEQRLHHLRLAELGDLELAAVELRQRSGRSCSSRAR